MKKEKFIKTMKKLSGDDKNIFILSCGLMNNNIQSVKDLENTLDIKLSENEVISMNKFMFKVNFLCKINNYNLYDYLSNEYFNLFIKGLI